MLTKIRQQDESFKLENFPIIVSVNGQKLPYSQMTNYLLESYEVDLSNMIDKVFSTNFGPELMQTRDCSKCGKKLTFSVSPDNG